MSSNSQSSSDENTHSEPIPINSAPHNRSRSWSVSESSDADSLPPLSPSQSPASAASVNVQTPFSSSSRITLSPVSPSSPILSYFYGTPNKSNPFSRPMAACPTFEDDESKEPYPTPTSTSAHRRMSTSWIPVRFGQQQNAPTESQQERGAGLLRRLSISTTLTSKPSAPTQSTQNRSTTPLKQDGGTPPDSNSGPRGTGLRKAATLSPGTADAVNKPRAPSPMGERMLKGHYDGF